MASYGVVLWTLKPKNLKDINAATAADPQVGIPRKQLVVTIQDRFLEL
jgi:hypothetical protein